MRAPTPTAAAELAVPVRADLLAQILDFERRMVRVFSRSMEDRRRHLAQLARVLPRAESLFATPRQRLDQASDRLGQALRRNLQIRRTEFTEAAALLRARMLKDRMAVCGERAAALGARAERAARGLLAHDRRRLEGLSRELDLISYRKVLERGFALVRGENGAVRRRAATLKPGEALTLTFADGEARAMAGEGDAPATPPKVSPQKKKPGVDQGSLF
jgi:exodeoxyribonuclease VII large subunit